MQNRWATKEKKEKETHGIARSWGGASTEGKKEKVYLFECLRWCQRLVSLNDCPIFQGLIVDTYKAYPWLSLCIFNAHGRNGLVLRTRVENYLPPPPSIKIPDSCILERTKRPAHDSNLFTNHEATSFFFFLFLLSLPSSSWAVRFPNWTIKRQLHFLALWEDR